MAKVNKTRSHWLDEEQYNGIKKMLDGGFSMEEISRVTGRHKVTLYKIKSSSDFYDYREKVKNAKIKYKASHDASSGSGITLSFMVNDVTHLSNESVETMCKALSAVFGTPKVFASAEGLPTEIREGE